VRRLLLGWITLAAAVALAAWLLSGVDVDGGIFTYLWIAALFAVVNLLLGTVLRVLSAPVILVTLGLFSVVINALLWLVTDWLSSSLDIDGFWNALLAGVIVSIVNVVVAIIFGPEVKRLDHR
jgi:putative membrane protein